eukprot:5959983-Amphidinium_carterae.1
MTVECNANEKLNWTTSSRVSFKVFETRLKRSDLTAGVVQQSGTSLKPENNNSNGDTSEHISLVSV